MIETCNHKKGDKRSPLCRSCHKVHVRNTADLILRQRFETFFVKTNKCWEWDKYLDKRGYGRFTYHGKTIRSHRMSWIIYRGPIQNELHVLHKCDRPICVNPDHLFLGTHTDNMRDAAKKGLFSIPHRNRKLTPEQVIEIRRQFKAGYKTSSIAEIHKIRPTHVSSIVHGWSWRYLLDN